MTGIIIIVVIVLVVVTLAASFGIYFYRRGQYHKHQVEQSLILVPVQVTIPRDEGERENESPKSSSEVARDLIAASENMYNSFFSLYSGGSFDKKVKNFLFNSPHLSMEIVAFKKEILFYVMVPVEFLTVIEKSITAQYPGAEIKRTKPINIFQKGRGFKGIKGGNIWGRRTYYYPIKTYQSIEDEPLDMLLNSLSMLEEDESAAIQIMLRPVDTKVMTSAKSLVEKIQKGPGQKTSAMDIASQVVNPKSDEPEKPAEPYRTTPLEEQVIKEVARKSSKFGFETQIRVLVAARDDQRADLVVNQIKSALNQYSDLSINGLKMKSTKNAKKLVMDYTFRYFEDSKMGGERFWPKKRGYKLILNTEELATLYHFPNTLIKTPGVKWLAAKSQQIPVNLPAEGIKFAHATFRGEEEDVKITPDDKMRHLYIIGQTGTGKSVLMKNMFISDIEAGNGVCFIDPHGEAIADLIARIPKERAEDVIIFDPSDNERPMGLNLFEAKTIEQQDLVIGEAISMLYRLYDPQHQGIMGPRFEHWFRNAALTLMAAPNGGTFIEVPRMFTDEAFLAENLKYVTDPVVRNFWISEMGQTADFHKSEVLGWFVGKFGAFMTNTTMRNIMGQPVSSLNIREIMDSKKILLVNLSKGVIGELNMQLLGMIFISKIQMAAMSRADIPEDQRVPFTLYIDEFQNFVTDNISGILSESRKYKLSMVMANQYIQQIREDIRDAVFGNVGSMISFRVGSEDGEFVGKQFEPEFSVSDIINQENLHGICKMTINGLPTRPFTIIDYFQPKLTDVQIETGKAIKELARLKYGRPREVVEAEVQERMKISPTAPQMGAVPREKTTG